MSQKLEEQQTKEPRRFDPQKPMWQIAYGILTSLLASLLAQRLALVAARIARLPATFTVGAIYFGVGVVVARLRVQLPVRLTIALLSLGLLVPVSLLVERTRPDTVTGPPSIGAPPVRRDAPLNLVLDVPWDLDSWARSNCYINPGIKIEFYDGGYIVSGDCSGKGGAELAPIDVPEPTYATCAGATLYSGEKVPISSDRPFVCVHTEGQRYALIKLLQLPKLGEQPRIVRMHATVWEHV